MVLFFFFGGQNCSDLLDLMNSGVPIGEEQLHRPHPLHKVFGGLQEAMRGHGRLQVLLLVPDSLLPGAELLLSVQVLYFRFLKVSLK